MKTQEAQQSYGSIQEKLQFEKMWHVKDFHGEITAGLGVLIAFSNGHYEEEKILFYPYSGTGALLTYKNQFHSSSNAASDASEREKKRKKEFYERQYKDAKEKLGL